MTVSIYKVNIFILKFSYMYKLSFFKMLCTVDNCVYLINDFIL